MWPPIMGGLDGILRLMRQHQVDNGSIRRIALVHDRAEAGTPTMRNMLVLRAVKASNRMAGRLTGRAGASSIALSAARALQVQCRGLMNHLGFRCQGLLDDSRWIIGGYPRGDSEHEGG